MSNKLIKVLEGLNPKVLSRRANSQQSLQYSAVKPSYYHHK
jgi:hypothetical protein